MSKTSLLKGIGLIFRKEMWTAFRERRTLIFLILFPLLVWPAFTAIPTLLIGGKERKAREKPSPVVLVMGEDIPPLFEDFKTASQIRLVDVEDPASAVKEKKAHCVVYVDSVSRDSLLIYTRISYDATQAESRVAANKVELVLSRYESQVVRQRLAEKGIDEDLLSAVQSFRQNIISPQQMLGFYMGLVIGMFIVMGAIMGAGSITIDSTAGEKERKTLELLLTVPIPRASIMLGKYLAGVTFAFISPILTALGMTLAAAFVVPIFSSEAGGSSSGLDLTGMVSAEKILLMLLVLLIMAAFIVALLMAIAVRARSNKQAQTFLAPLNIIVVIPVIFLQIIPAVPPTWMFFIPFLNVMLYLRGLLMNTLPTMAVVYTLASNFVFLVLALRSAARGFGSEKILLK